MRSEADISQLNLPHGTKNKKSGKELKSKKKQMCSEVSVNSPKNPWSQPWRRKRRLRWEGFAEKKGFQPGIKEWRGGGWRWRVGVSLIDGEIVTHRTKWIRIEKISAWLTERSRSSFLTYNGTRSRRQSIVYCSSVDCNTRNTARFSLACDGCAIIYNTCNC